MEKEELKRLSVPFKIGYKPYIGLNPFGMPNARMIAAALPNGFCHVEKKDFVLAAAVFNRMKSGSKHTDFYGRTIQIKPGESFIKHVAALDENKKALADVLQKASNKITWLEIYEEDLWLRKTIQELGFEYITSKISAYAEVRGIYLKGKTYKLPSIDPLDDLCLHTIISNFISAKDLRRVQTELTKYEGRWANHYSNYNKRNSWSAVALRGYTPSDPSDIIKPTEMTRKWRDTHKERLKAHCLDTVAAKHFKCTMGLVGQLPGRTQRVRFMRLSGGGELGRHNDVTAGDEGVAIGKIARFHVPIVSHPFVDFIQWGTHGEKQVTNFQEGNLYYMDQRKPHQVINHDPNKERIHLVVDLIVDAAARKLMASSAGISLKEKRKGFFSVS